MSNRMLFTAGQQKETDTKRKKKIISGGCVTLLKPMKQNSILYSLPINDFKVFE